MDKYQFLAILSSIFLIGWLIQWHAHYLSKNASFSLDIIPLFLLALLIGYFVAKALH